MSDADLVLVNGNIVTMGTGPPRAAAVAIKSGKLVAVGTDRDALAYASKDTRRIDLRGKTVVPGFIDCHVHGASLGRSLSQIPLRDVTSIEVIKQRVRQRARTTPKGEWISGRGWDQDRLVEHRYPTRFDLDEATPDHPVILTRVCGHVAVINSNALKQAQVDKTTGTPTGGWIDRDSAGNPMGILRENAIDLVARVLPEPTEESVSETCLLACQRMVEQGITTAHWIISSASELRALQGLRKRGLLPLRVYVLIPVEQLDSLVDLGLVTGLGNDELRIGSVKLLLDGSLGGRTAALTQPYSDDPSTSGMLLYSKRRLEKLVKKAHQADLQLAIHAIGDKAITLALEVLEKAAGKAQRNLLRHRLEHASVLSPKLIARMREIGVVASVQPHFVASDFWVGRRLGNARTQWSYAFKGLHEAGVKVVGGSDAPVEPVSPILGIYASVVRRTNRRERLTVDEALQLYTLNAAYCSFEENVKGSIEVDKFADLTVLSHDPYTITPAKLKSIKVEMTVVNGVPTYTRRK